MYRLWKLGFLLCTWLLGLGALPGAALRAAAQTGTPPRAAQTGVPPQEVHFSGTTTLRWTRDTLGLMEVPLLRGDSSYDFIFDTGAGMSTITESFADRLKLRRVGGSLSAQSGTGFVTQSKLALADSLFLGNVLLKNVVFLVMPDAQLFVGHHQINAILGLPVIAALEEVHVFRDGRMTVGPATPLGAVLPNMSLVNHDLIVSAVVEGDTLPFQFDSGAGATELLPRYFHKHGDWVRAHGKDTTIRQSSVGGAVKTKVYRLPDLYVVIGGKALVFANVDVLARDSKAYDWRPFYGIIGQDVFQLVPEVVFDFKDMVLRFP